MLPLADIDNEVFCLWRCTDNHAFVNRNTCTDKQRTTFLCIIQTIGDSIAGFKRNQRTGIPSWNFALVWFIAVEHAVHNAFALGIGQEFTLITEQSSGRNQEGQASTAALWMHILQFCLTSTQLFHNRTNAFFRHVNNHFFDWLVTLAIDFVIQNPRGRNAQKGAVFKVDLDTYKIVGQVTVGYQPDELAIIGGRAYVANSGGYRAPNYDSTVSVIELETMRQMYKIDVAINLSRIKADAYGNLWVSSRGNYDDVPSNLYRLEPNGGRYQVAEAMNIPASNMIISGDSLYVYSVEYSNQTSKNTVTYAIIDVKKKRVVSRKFITDGTKLDIVIPYGIAIHPRNGDIYVTDAKNYVSSGVLHCYSREGVHKWSVRTGDIPAHMVFLERKQTRQ